ncbi:MAG: hypothetical protein V4792_07610 [Pseudomonadota bacterium]
MRRNIEFIVYLVGAVLLGLSYPWLEQALSSRLLFFALGLLYLVALRLIGRALARRYGESARE